MQCKQCGAPAEEKMSVCPVCGKARSGEDRFCSECGYDFEKKPSAAASAQTSVSAPQPSAAAAVRKPFPKKQVIAAVAVVAVIAILLAILIPTISFFTNKFRIGVVEKINLGDSREQVLDLLGEPYDYKEGSSFFEYYSDNYRKLLEQNDSFNPDDIQDWDDFGDAFDEALELEQKLQTEECRYIAVTFDSEGGVSSVFLDTARSEQNTGKKALKSYSMLNETVYAYAETELFYTAEYTDGSYYMGATSVTVNEVGNIIIHWNDRYGNECSAPASVVASADVPSGEGWYYDEQEKVLHIHTDDASYIGHFPKDVVAVEFGSGITQIGNSAFKDCIDLTEIVIPDSVTSIGNYAFQDCTSLMSVTIGDSITSIGKGAFLGCESLTSVTIGDGVTSIGVNAFYNCDSLTSISVTTGNPVYHSAGNCLIETESKTLIVGCKNSIIPDDGSVTSIGDWAFVGYCSLTNITIPNDVTSIGKGAFQDCIGLTSITIPDSVTYIGDSAFSSCKSLTSVVIGNGVTSIGDSAFSSCSRLTSVTIPDSVTSIGNGAFSGCDSFTSITIPDSVTFIGEYAFNGCESLTGITLPDDVTSIGEFTFSGCKSLTSITIPDSVTSIGEWAFNVCDSLTSITIGDSVTSIGSHAFYSCDNLASATFVNPNGWSVDSAALSAEDLSDPATAAKYLSDTYYWDAWTRA